MSMRVMAIILGAVAAVSVLTLIVVSERGRPAQRAEQEQALAKFNEAFFKWCKQDMAGFTVFDKYRNADKCNVPPY